MDITEHTANRFCGCSTCRYFKGTVIYEPVSVSEGRLLLEYKLTRFEYGADHWFHYVLQKY